MNKARIEAFSDGVIAILITLMIFEIKPPTGTSSAELQQLVWALLTHTMSFLYLGIYWNNHHHMFSVVQRIQGPVLWSNLHLLFWLSLIPFSTAWLRVSNFDKLQTAAYGFILLGSAIAYKILQTTLIQSEGNASLLGNAIGQDVKGKSSLAGYVLGLLLALWLPSLALTIYVLIAALWLIPDRRIEKLVKSRLSEAANE